MSRPDVPPDHFRFKDLCLDAVDPGRVATFWGGALGLPVEARGSGSRLADDVPEHTGAVADLVGLGATVIDERQRWTVLGDPEGGELCAFVRPSGRPADRPTYRLYELAVDAVDAVLIATWWAQRSGVAVERSADEDFCWLEGVPGCRGRWSSSRCLSRSGSRTACTGTSEVRPRTRSTPAPG